MKTGYLFLFGLAVICTAGVNPMSAQDCEPNIALDFHVKDIQKSQAEVEAYDPARGGSMVHESNDCILHVSIGRDRNFRRRTPYG